MTAAAAGVHITCDYRIRQSRLMVLGASQGCSWPAQERMRLTRKSGDESIPYRNPASQTPWLRSKGRPYSPRSLRGRQFDPVVLQRVSSSFHCLTSPTLHMSEGSFRTFVKLLQHGRHHAPGLREHALCGRRHVQALGISRHGSKPSGRV